VQITGQTHNLIFLQIYCELHLVTSKFSAFQLLRSIAVRLTIITPQFSYVNGSYVRLFHIMSDILYMVCGYLYNKKAEP